MRFQPAFLRCCHADGFTIRRYALLLLFVFAFQIRRFADIAFRFLSLRLRYIAGQPLIVMLMPAAAMLCCLCHFPPRLKMISYFR